MGIRGVESSAPEVKKRRMATLYVGNLAWSTTAETLTAWLAANGTVTNVDTGTVRNGRTRGWAIVECSDQDAANNIIQMCNGQDCDGRTLTVRLDNKPEASTGRQIVVRNLAAPRAGVPSLSPHRKMLKMPSRGSVVLSSHPAQWWFAWIVSTKRSVFYTQLKSSQVSVPQVGGSTNQTKDKLSTLVK